MRTLSKPQTVRHFAALYAVSEIHPVSQRETTKGGAYRFNLHETCDGKSNLLNIAFTAENVRDSQAVEDILHQCIGAVCG
jgi:hypothetical protein